MLASNHELSQSKIQGENILKNKRDAIDDLMLDGAEKGLDSDSEESDGELAFTLVVIVDGTSLYQKAFDEISERRERCRSPDLSQFSNGMTDQRQNRIVLDQLAENSHQYCTGFSLK